MEVDPSKNPQKYADSDGTDQKFKIPTITLHNTTYTTRKTGGGQSPPPNFDNFFKDTKYFCIIKCLKRNIKLTSRKSLGHQTHF